MRVKLLGRVWNLRFAPNLANRGDCDPPDVPKKEIRVLSTLTGEDGQRLSLKTGRTEMMKAHGFDYAALERDGCLLAVVDVGLRYLAPARFGEEVTIDSWIAEVERVRVRFDYLVRRVDAAATPLCRGHTLLASVDRALVPRRLPEAVRARMVALQGSGPAAR